MSVDLSAMSLSTSQPSKRRSPAQERWQAAAIKIRGLVQGMQEIKSAGYTGAVLKDLYWLEKLIPEHPSGEEYFHHLKKWKTQTSSPASSFEEWAKTAVAPHEEWDESKKKFVVSTKTWETSTTYLNSDERQRYCLSVQEGKLYTRNGTLFNSAYAKSRKRNHFVIGPDRELYVFSKNKTVSTDRWQHSTIFSGGAVIGAGTIEVNPEGEIIEITNESGHYRTDERHTLDYLKILYHKGIPLANVKLEVHHTFKFYGREQYQISFFNSALTYLSTTGHCTPDDIEEDD